MFTVSDEKIYPAMEMKMRVGEERGGWGQGVGLSFQILKYSCLSVLSAIVSIPINKIVSCDGLQ